MEALKNQFQRRTYYSSRNIHLEHSSSIKKPIKVAVTGASGYVANHLLFMLASGDVYGKDQPLHLMLLGREESYVTLEGVAMELEDSVFPLLQQVVIGTDPVEVFQDADWCIMIGAQRHVPGVPRSSMLTVNGEIYKRHGEALNRSASVDCKVVVVGNPCNSNALIAMENAPRIPRRNFHALTRLDENRAKFQLALRMGKPFTSISSLAIWGNHSVTQVPDLLNACVEGQPALSTMEDHQWYKTEFVPLVAGRGLDVSKKWGRSSAPSTAIAIADAIRALVVPTAPGNCFSTAVCSDGNPYGVQEGLIFSFPCRSTGNGSYEICDGFVLDDWLASRITASQEELAKEKSSIMHLL